MLLKRLKPSKKNLSFLNLKSLEDERTKNYLLETIMDKLPCHVYWLDCDNIYLGCNDLQAERLGISSKEEIIGKTNYDLHTVKEADELNKINNIVMTTRTPYECEEASSIKATNSIVSNYLSRKTPLFDINGKVIGLLGVSVDITDRKKAEELQTKLQLQQEINTIAKQVAHDIRSPLAALAMLTQYLKNISEKERSLFKGIAANIEKIANDLLERYTKSDNIKDVVNEIDKDYTSLHWCLIDVINSKRYQYEGKNVILNYSPPIDKFVFMKGNFSNFCRMISNIIDNGIEAIEDKEGIIDIDFKVKEGKVEIKVKDNGKGMSKEIVDKILNDEEVKTIKKRGHGIGMQQIRRTMKAMKGEMGIKSGKDGTEVKLIFPVVNPPEWIADNNIVLHKGDTIVVLDDDISIHDVWEKRFEEFGNDINTKCFTQGLEAIEFINTIKEKDKVFLLADYELRGQNIDGVDVIEKSGMQNKSFLVTNTYISTIRDFDEKSKFIKVLSKTFINDVSIVVR
jgi:signal transduction histidine kinase